MKHDSAKKQTAAEKLKAARDIRAKNIAEKKAEEKTRADEAKVDKKAEKKKQKDEKQTSAKASKPRLLKRPAANGNIDVRSKQNGKIRVEHPRSQIVGIKIDEDGKNRNKCFGFGVNKKYTTIEEAKLAGLKWVNGEDLD